MKRIALLSTLAIWGMSAFAQNSHKGKIIEVPEGKGFYNETILKDVSHVNDSLAKKTPETRFVMDQSGLKLPNKVSLYKRQWANPVISQGNTGTCWDFSTLSFYESEIFRLQGKKVKLSEIYNAYWEYVD